jgi:hypothetical protein
VGSLLKRKGGKDGAPYFAGMGLILSEDGIETYFTDSEGKLIYR